MRSGRSLRPFIALALALSGCSASLPATQRTPAAATSPSESGLPSGSASTIPITPPSSSEPAFHGNVYEATTVGKFSSAVAGVPERVYVPDSQGRTITIIDPATFTILGHFTGGVRLEHIAPDWDLSVLYAASEVTNILTVIDPRTVKVLRTITGVDDPYNMYFSPDGTKQIVVAERHHRIDFYSRRPFKLLKRLPIGPAGVDHMDFSADGRFLFVSTEYAGVLIKIDIAAMAIAATVHLGGLPVDVKLSPDASTLLVADQGRNGIAFVNPETMQETKFLPTGAGAHGMAISRDLKSIYLTNRKAGTISVIDPVERRVTATWNVGGTPDMIQISPDGSQLWTSNRYKGTVSVVDTRTGKVIHLITVGGSPHGLCYFPQPGRYSVGHNGVYR